MTIHVDSNNLMFAETSSSNRQATRFLSFGTSKELFTTLVVSLTNLVKKKGYFANYYWVEAKVSLLVEDWFLIYKAIINIILLLILAF